MANSRPVHRTCTNVGDFYTLTRVRGPLAIEIRFSMNMEHMREKKGAESTFGNYKCYTLCKNKNKSLLYTTECVG